MEITITKKRVLEISQAMKLLAEQAKSVRLAYALAKNIASVQAEVEALGKAREWTKAYKKYDEKRGNIASTFAKLDAEGKPVQVGSAQNAQYIIEDQAALNRKLEPLQAEHKEAIDEQDIRNDTFEKLLTDDLAVKIHQITLAQLEEEGAFEPEAKGLGNLFAPLMDIVIVETVEAPATPAVPAKEAAA